MWTHACTIPQILDPNLAEGFADVTKLCRIPCSQEEFVDVMLMLSKPSEMEEKRNLEKDLLRVFREFDVDQSGNIDGQELGLALEKLGRKMTPEEVTDLLNEIDDDGSGEIGFVEFASIFGVEVEDINYEAAEKGEAMQKLRWGLNPAPC